MSRRPRPCRCCLQPSGSALCEHCAFAHARRDTNAAAIIRRLFGTLGWEQFTAALRAERVRASRQKRTGEAA